MIELKRSTNVAWRRFLATEAGIEGMLWLREKLPDVLKGSGESIIFDAGKTQGYKDCLDQIANVMGVVEAKIENYENP